MILIACPQGTSVPQNRQQEHVSACHTLAVLAAAPHCDDTPRMNRLFAPLPFSCEPAPIPLKTYIFSNTSLFCRIISHDPSIWHVITSEGEVRDCTAATNNTKFTLPTQSCKLTARPPRQPPSASAIVLGQQSVTFTEFKATIHLYKVACDK